MKRCPSNYLSRRPAVRIRAGFTLIELVTVIVILGVLAAVAMPLYLDYTMDSKKAACRGALGGMRAAVTNYYAYTIVNSGGATPAFATIAQLTTPGAVLSDAVPNNPFDTDSTKNNVVDATGLARGTISGRSGGWCYNPTNGQIWANTATKLVNENAY